VTYPSPLAGGYSRCMNWFSRIIAASPKQALVAAKALLLVGGLLVIAGMYGRSQLIEVNQARTEQNLPPFRALAESHPDLPTWFVPEGPVGFIVAGGIVMLAIFLATRAKQAADAAWARRPG
jgi:Flp pilus assembly protein protease CpaA